MPHIQDLLAGRTTEINYPEIIRQFPWIVRRNLKCILSPDSDGLLCGLLMSNYLGWKIVGYYDGKMMLLKRGVSTHDDDCVFLDMEIYREHVKSVGHHMVLLNRRHRPTTWSNYRNCLQPNNLRNYDGANDFRLKYPLATIHFLLGILGAQYSIEVPISAIAPLFFTDGTFNVLYSYPENVLNWLNYLGINNNDSPLRKVFMHNHFTVYQQIQEMDQFFRKRDTLNRRGEGGQRGERGDKFVISRSDGTLKNTELQTNGMVKINAGSQDKVKGFIRILAESTGWQYIEEDWAFEDLRPVKFTKSSFQARGWTVTNRDFAELMALNPLSWAMTSGQNIEFTLETPDSLP